MCKEPQQEAKGDQIQLTSSFHWCVIEVVEAVKFPSAVTAAGPLRVPFGHLAPEASWDM